MTILAPCGGMHILFAVIFAVLINQESFDPFLQAIRCASRHVPKKGPFTCFPVFKKTMVNARSNAVTEGRLVRGWAYLPQVQEPGAQEQLEQEQLELPQPPILIVWWWMLWI